MSQFIVDAASLRAVATNLQELNGNLSEIPTSAPYYVDYIGSKALAEEILDFTHKWHYGVTEVSGEIAGMVTRVNEAAAAYEKADREVGRGRTSPVGKPPTGGPGSGSHHHHHPKGVDPHPRPVRPGGGSGSGTTTVGGGGNGNGGGPSHGSHAPIHVHSNLLTSDQSEFVAKLAALTGLNPRVIGAWCLAEESDKAADERQSEGNNDWLNIGYDDSGRVGSSYGNVWSNPDSAAEQTAKFLEGKWDGADPSIQAIMKTAGESPDAQIQAIYESKWASSHYGDPPGSILRSTYQQLSGLTVTKG